VITKVITREFTVGILQLACSSPIASYRFPTNNAGADDCEPKQALDAIPPDGVFIFALDYGQLSAAELNKDFPPKQQRFRLTGLADYECMGHS
jgi:hypothetical protein